MTLSTNIAVVDTVHQTTYTIRNFATDATVIVGYFLNSDQTSKAHQLVLNSSHLRMLFPGQSIKMSEYFRYEEDDMCVFTIINVRDMTYTTGFKRTMHDQYANYADVLNNQNQNLAPRPSFFLENDESARSALYTHMFSIKRGKSKFIGKDGTAMKPIMHTISDPDDYVNYITPKNFRSIFSAPGMKFKNKIIKNQISKGDYYIIGEIKLDMDQKCDTFLQMFLAPDDASIHARVIYLENIQPKFLTSWNMIREPGKYVIHEMHGPGHNSIDFFDLLEITKLDKLFSSHLKRVLLSVANHTFISDYSNDTVLKAAVYSSRLITTFNIPLITRYNMAQKKHIKNEKDDAFNIDCGDASNMQHLKVISTLYMQLPCGIVTRFNDPLIYRHKCIKL